MSQKKPDTLNVNATEAVDTDIRSVVLEPDLLGKSLAYVVKRAAVRCDAFLMQQLRGEISPARVSALACVGANPGMTQSALGTLLGIAGPSVFKVVDDLAQLGLLERAPGADRRSSALHLTAAGCDRLAHYEEAVKRTEDTITKQLTPSEQAQLFILLGKLGASAQDAPGPV